MAKMRSKYKNSNFHKKRVANKSTFLAKGAGRFRKSPYQEIDEEGYPGFNNHDAETDYEMDQRFLAPRRTKTGFEHIGSMDRASMVFEEVNKPDDGGQNSDLNLFVQSLSKCLGATKFGLSFEFQNLGFKAPKSNKKILDQVSGNIHAGSLWGVMGASGAGKCKIGI